MASRKMVVLKEFIFSERRVEQINGAKAETAIFLSTGPFALCLRVAGFRLAHLNRSLSLGEIGRNEIMRVFIRTVFLFSFVALFSTVAFACSCEFWSASKKLRKAKAVFVGEAIEIGNNDKSADFPVAIKFKVEQYWKGAKQETITVVTTPLACCTCALGATVGRKYLIFAFETEEGQLETSLCTSTGYDNATDELKVLGKGKKLKSKTKT
jgi:hypothetical protein